MDTADDALLPPAKKLSIGFDFDRVYNAMPHALAIQMPDGSMHTVAKTSGVLRLSEADAQSLQTEPAAVIAPPVYTGVELLVDNEPASLNQVPHDACLLVSALVGEYVRTNGLPAELVGCTVFSPATGPAYAVRSSTGAIIGTKALVRYV